MLNLKSAMASGFFPFSRKSISQGAVVQIEANPAEAEKFRPKVLMEKPLCRDRGKKPSNGFIGQHLTVSVVVDMRNGRMKLKRGRQPMKLSILNLVPTAALGLALLGTTAKADLVLSGETTGSFESAPITPSTATVTITNDSTTDTALWQSGVGDPGAPTSILFQGEDFVDVTSGMPIDVGLFTIHNGIDELGTTADDAFFDLGLNLTTPVTESVFLTTFDFGINNTPNNPSLKPDTYSVNFTEPPPMYVDDYLVKFNVVFSPPVIAVGEGDTTTRGDVFVTFTPVPEPSTYALWGALLLGGIIAYRRLGMTPKGMREAA
jgi:hypothetical protein